MKTRIGDFNDYGTKPTADGMMFTFSAEGEGFCAILLYHVSDGSLAERVEVDSSYAIGTMYSVVLLGKNWHRYVYLLEDEGKTFVDPYASQIHGRNKWADMGRQEMAYRVFGGFSQKEYVWQADRPKIRPQDMIIYKLHMRGFSMHHGLSSGKKGNYKGILEKLQELKDMGITTIEFQPIYDFEEIRYERRQIVSSKGKIEETVVPLDKINYWGYGEAFYLAPKASYFGGRDCVYHCKEMIDRIHEMNMEVVMEVSFAADISEDMMMDVLWRWCRDYRVDGFHLVGCNAPIERIARHKGLASCKIFYENIPQEVLQREKKNKHLFLYNDYFMHVTRQIQNHMQGSMVQFTNHLRRQNDHFGFVNYIANTDGFTLWDSYSYGEKHNEANGEDNKDGKNINYSYNYGVEGQTKNRQINQMRLRQIRNGLCSVFLAQAIPLLRGGDEVLNSQEGNNNPYCQDNAIGWVSYGRNLKSKEKLQEFVRNLIAFRREHPVLSMDQAVRMTDYKHIGIPDISYHGAEPWLMGIGEERKAVGILYAGDYAKKTGEHKAENVYIAYNFHYHDVELALPAVSGHRRWYFVMNTAAEESFSFQPVELKDQQRVWIPGSSVSIYVS